MAVAPLIFAGLAAAGSGIGAIAAIQSGRASAQIEKQNAIIARQRAVAEAGQHRIDTLRMLGTTRAAYGASGAQLTGSASDVLSDDAVTAGRENAMILWGGEGEANAARSRGIAARSRGYGQGASTLLTGAADSYDRFSSL
jgi:hypothetical protein